MALAEVHLYSQTLVKQVAMTVVLPDAGRGPFATFYLLHGLSDDHTIWQRRTRIEWYVRELPMIVVMPDGYRGFYTNNEQGPAYGDFFSKELPEFVERIFPARKDDKKLPARCIGGLSMGGYGALRLALANPARFASVTSHSGALLTGTNSRADAAQQSEFRRIFGESPAGSDHDLMELAARAAKSKRSPLPRIRIDCGVDDGLLNDNRRFHQHLTKLKIAHEYEEFPGAHNWDYWEIHVRDAVKFHARALCL